MVANWRRVVDDSADRATMSTTRREFLQFNMEQDPHETTNVLDQYPEVANRLKGFAEQHRRQFYAKE